MASTSYSASPTAAAATSAEQPRSVSFQPSPPRASSMAAKVVPNNAVSSPSFSPIITPPAFSPRLNRDILGPSASSSSYPHVLTSIGAFVPEAPVSPVISPMEEEYNTGRSLHFSTSYNVLPTSASSASLSTLHPGTPPGPELRFLCFDLAVLNPASRFVLLSGGIFAFFILNSYLEEFIFRQLPSFTYGWYLTQFELTLFALFAVIERWLSQPTSESLWAHKASLRFHLYVALAMTASRGLTNVSLQYLNYPTQVIFKSMKLLTVMAGSLCILRQSFHPIEYLCAACLVASACLFSYGDHLVSTGGAGVGLVGAELGASLHVGVVIVLLSLVADAFHATTQDTLMRAQHASTLETMLFTNAFSSLLALLVTVVNGELLPAFRYCLAHAAAYPLFVVRAVIIYLGVLCFLLMIKSFGVVRATAVTTVRKILSVLLSFVLFPKGWSPMYVWGFLAFCAGLGGSVWVTKATGKAGKTVGKDKHEEEELSDEGQPDSVEAGEAQSGDSQSQQWLLSEADDPHQQPQQNTQADGR